MVAVFAVFVCHCERGYIPTQRVQTKIYSVVWVEDPWMFPQQKKTKIKDIQFASNKNN